MMALILTCTAMTGLISVIVMLCNGPLSIQHPSIARTYPAKASLTSSSLNCTALENRKLSCGTNDRVTSIDFEPSAALKSSWRFKIYGDIQHWNYFYTRPHSITDPKLGQSPTFDGRVFSFMKWTPFCQISQRQKRLPVHLFIIPIGIEINCVFYHNEIDNKDLKKLCAMKRKGDEKRRKKT